MRRLASEVLRDLEIRVANLENREVLSQILRMKREVKYKDTAKVEVMSNKFYSETFDEHFFVVKFSFSKGPYFSEREESFFVVREDEDGDLIVGRDEWRSNQYHLALDYAKSGELY